MSKDPHEIEDFELQSLSLDREPNAFGETMRLVVPPEDEAVVKYINSELDKCIAEMLNRRIWLNKSDRWMLEAFQPHWRPTIGWWDDQPQVIDDEYAINKFFADFPGLEEEWNARRVDSTDELP